MMEQQLPEGWQMVKFGDIAKHISVRVEPGNTDLKIYVGLEHLESDSLKIKRYGVPADVEGQKLLVKKGQIIFVNVEPTNVRWQLQSGIAFVLQMQWYWRLILLLLFQNFYHSLCNRMYL